MCWNQCSCGSRANILYSGFDFINGAAIDESPQAAAVASHNGQRIGHVYTKAMFREYADASFSQQSPRPEVSLQILLDFADRGMFIF